MLKRTGLTTLLILLALAFSVAGASAQTPPTTPSQAENLPEAWQLLFPSLPASYATDEVQSPSFNGAANGFDLLTLGTLPDPQSTAPLSKTLTLKLSGGIKGRIFSAPAWVNPVPEQFVNIKGPGELKIAVNVRQDSGKGAGLLPAQTNWGRMRVNLNGGVFDYTTRLIVGPPAGITPGSGDKIFSLYRSIVARLDGQGDLGAAISTPIYPNAGQLILGVVVDYLGENSYNGKMNEVDFITRVAETLAEKDYNSDGWAGFKAEDVVLGAPGWLLGRKLK